MKVVVIGMGSMGKRRIRLLKKFDPNIEIFGIDLNVERQQEVKKLFGVIVCESISEAVKEGCTAAFVSTSPLAHSAIIQECLKQDLNVFTELNVVSDGYEVSMKLAEEHDKVLFLSSTFLYRSEIGYIRKRVNEVGGSFGYFYHVGQYLPDWHPWEKIQDFFVFDKKTNGVREVLVREIPWLTETFGDIESWHVEKSKISSLELNYPDAYFMIFNHKGGTKGCVMMDVVARRSSINLEVISENLYIRWDGTPTGVKELNFFTKEEENIMLYNSFEHDKNYANNIVEDAYSNEIEAFFNQIENGTKPIYDFKKDQRVLDIMDGIEEDMLNE